MGAITSQRIFGFCENPLRPAGRDREWVHNHLDAPRCLCYQSDVIESIQRASIPWIEYYNQFSDGRECC